VPVLVAVVGGEQVEQLRLFGIVVALLAVVLISLPGGERTLDDQRRRRIDLGELPLVLIAGLGFAGFFLCLDRATAVGGTWWPLVAVRLTGLLAVVIVFGAALSRAREPSLSSRIDRLLGLPRLRARGVPPLQLGVLLVATGLGDLGGNAFFILAAQAGELSVAVVLASLYPVVTTILAALLLRERLRPVQIVGVVAATLSVILLQ
jgi:drug/metabolite transporter (DMT)-like permease